MKFEKKKIEQFDLKNQVVLMRADLNVPLDSNQRVADDTRIQACLPTIKYILKEGGAVILLAHLGRPKGKINEKLSLKHVVPLLSELLGQKVKFSSDCVGKEVEELKKNLKPGEVLVLENVRFHPEEEKPELNPEFSKELASHAQIYVNDSFSTSHRPHVSSCTIVKHFPEKACMGFSLAKEEKYLKEKLLKPERPFVAIIGGSKISSKIGVLKSLIEKADKIIIGGAMAHTFFKALGLKVGKSLNEPEFEETAHEIVDLCKSKKIPLILPEDLIVVEQIDASAPQKIVSYDQIGENQIGVDVGPRTLELYKNELKGAGTVFWNGPLGITEIEAFSKGTKALAQVLADLDCVTIVGGGDSVAALKKLKLADKMTYISTGGGASLEYIEKGQLPGIEALSDCK